jgi:NAD+--dinitrogen-reductase ADP-D-ribosyltransferase
MDYMTVHFRLESLEDAGLEPGRRKKKRTNANYLRMVRGWSFDADGREGAVLKNWTETRFGLLARHHAGPLGDRDSDARHAYMRQASAGIYATNAIEAQLDLLYTYCQHEMARQHPHASHLTLYRGVNRIGEHEILARCGRGRYRVLLNNLSSFTASRERAEEFGDYTLEVSVPLPKVFFFNRLLPGMLKGEDEFVVIGGVYAVTLAAF